MGAEHDITTDSHRRADGKAHHADHERHGADHHRLPARRRASETDRRCSSSGRGLPVRGPSTSRGARSASGWPPSGHGRPGEVSRPAARGPAALRPPLQDGQRALRLVRARAESGRSTRGASASSASQRVPISRPRSAPISRSPHMLGPTRSTTSAAVGLRPVDLPRDDALARLSPTVARARVGAQTPPPSWCRLRTTAPASKTASPTTRRSEGRRCRPRCTSIRLEATATAASPAGHRPPPGRLAQRLDAGARVLPPEARGSQK